MRATLFLIVLVVTVAVGLGSPALAPAAAQSYPVTTASDTGPGSLRDAITQANANPGRDTITFAIAAGGPVKTIQLQSALPTISDDVILDGSTQTGASCAPRDIRIRIVAAVPIDNGLRVEVFGTSGGTTIRGVETGGQFTSSHIDFAFGGDHKLECSNIGTDANGTIDASNASVGVRIEQTAHDVTIGGVSGAGNIISGNGTGIYLERTADIHIYGNTIGLDRTGTVALANSGSGILAVGSRDINIGGTVPGQGNVISGNGVDGIWLDSLNTLDDPDFPTHDVTIEGNRIGTNAAGSAAIGNQRSGIRMVSVAHVYIGGAAPTVRNIISGNTGEGVIVTVSLFAHVPPTSDVEFSGNYIGLGADGVTALGNGIGVSVYDGDGVVIGGDTPDKMNVISGNTFDGIQANDSGAVPRVANLQVIGNRIGTSADGMTAVPNGDGIYLANSAGHSVLNNLVSGNTFQGVILATTAPFAVTNVTVKGNTIGYAADGTTPMPNGSHGIFSGITFPSGAGLPQNVIGGTGPGEANRIFSDKAGVRGVYLGSGTSQTTVRGNSIIAREGQSLDLSITTDTPRGYTPNGASTVGPNSLLHTPILTTAAAGTPGHIAGTLSGVAASSTFHIDLYRSRTCNDLTRNAQTYLGSVDAISDAQGGASFATDLGSLIAGDLVTATTTDSTGNTSELSPVLVATGLPGPADLRIVPCERTAGWETFTIRAFGPNFDQNAQLQIVWNGTPLDTTFVSSTELDATVTAEMLGKMRGSATVTVIDTSPFATQAALTQQNFLIPRSSADTDCNGQTEPADATRLLRIIAGMLPNTGACSANADRKGSTVTPNASDVLWVLRESASLIPDPLLSTNP